MESVILTSTSENRDSEINNIFVEDKGSEVENNLFEEIPIHQEVDYNDEGDSLLSQVQEIVAGNFFLLFFYCFLNKIFDNVYLLQIYKQPAQTLKEAIT